MITCNVKTFLTFILVVNSRNQKTFQRTIVNTYLPTNFSVCFKRTVSIRRYNCTLIQCTHRCNRALNFGLAFTNAPILFERAAKAPMRPREIAGSSEPSLVAYTIGIQISKLYRTISFGPRREKTCLRRFANNKGADQPAHPRSLISAFAIRFFESTIWKLTTSEISIF